MRIKQRSSYPSWLKASSQVQAEKSESHQMSKHWVCAKSDYRTAHNRLKLHKPTDYVQLHISEAFTTRHNHAIEPDSFTCKGSRRRAHRMETSFHLHTAKNQPEKEIPRSQPLKKTTTQGEKKKRERASNIRDPDGHKPAIQPNKVGPFVCFFFIFKAKDSFEPFHKTAKITFLRDSSAWKAEHLSTLRTTNDCKNRPNNKNNNKIAVAPRHTTRSRKPKPPPPPPPPSPPATTSPEPQRSRRPRKPSDNGEERRRNNPRRETRLRNGIPARNPKKGPTQIKGRQEEKNPELSSTSPARQRALSLRLRVCFLRGEKEGSF